MAGCLFKIKPKMSTPSDFFEIDEDCPLPKCSIILLLLLLSFLLLLLFLLYFKRKVLLKKFRIHPFPFQNRQGGGRKGVKAEGKKEEEGRWKIQKFKTPLKGERTQKPAKGLWMEGGKTEEKEKRGKEGGELGEEVKGKKEVERGRAMKMTSISEYLHNKESLISRVMDFEEVESFDTVYPAKKKDAARRRVNESGANLPTVTKRKISQDQYCLVQEKSEVVLKNRPRRSVSLNINENIEFLESTEKKTETRRRRRRWRRRTK